MGLNDFCSHFDCQKWSFPLEIVGPIDHYLRVGGLSVGLVPAGSFPALKNERKRKQFRTGTCSGTDRLS
jgi:hypothetical protein